MYIYSFVSSVIYRDPHGFDSWLLYILIFGSFAWIPMLICMAYIRIGKEDVDLHRVALRAGLAILVLYFGTVAILLLGELALSFI